MSGGPDNSDTGGEERAFEALRAEVAGLRQAVEDRPAPDYALTLGELVATQRRHTSLLAGLWRVLVGEARDDDPPWLRHAALVEATARQGSLLASIDQRLAQKSASDDRVAELLKAMADALATLDRDTTARLEGLEARVAEVLLLLRPPVS